MPSSASWTTPRNADARRTFEGPYAPGVSTDTAQRPVVIVTEGSAPRPLDWLKERADVRELGPADSGFDAALALARGAVVRTYTTVDEAFLARAPNLKVVGRGGVGLDNIDVAACRSRGVEVVYTPDANTLAVVDLLFAQLIRLIRPLNELRGSADVTKEAWKRARGQAGWQLFELTLGILGMGRVGRAVGRVASHGFGMNVIYHDLADVSHAVDFPAEAVSRDRLLAAADILTIHVDGRPGNRHLIDADALDSFGGKYLVNMSRGMVLDAVAVARAYEAGRLAGVALDVYDPEPPPADFPLLALVEQGENVLLTPHMASRTKSAVENMSWVVRDVIAVLSGEPPRFPAP